MSLKTNRVTQRRQTLIYAGRFKSEVETHAKDEYGLQGLGVLDEWEVGKQELAHFLREARLLMVLDPLSFPWELVDSQGWDTPMAVSLDVGLDAADLSRVLGSDMLEKLGFFDYLITSDYPLWEQLRDRYGWAERQLLFATSDSKGQLASEMVRPLEEEPLTRSFFGGDGYEAHFYWSERGESLAKTMPHRAICSLHHDRKSNKAMHRVQVGVMGAQFERMLCKRSTDNPAHVLEVGAGIGRWASVLNSYPVRFTGVDISEGMVEAGRANFPNHSFHKLDDDLGLAFDDESFDMVLSVTVMHHNAEEDKRRLTAEMWRVTKPGGKLLFLEDFVTGKQNEKSVVYPMGIGQFCSLLQECTAGRVVLDHIEALRYPHDRMHRGGLLSLSKIGAATRW